MEFISKSYDETIKIGQDFAKKLKPGDVVLLTGDLGVGKTAFTNGILKAKNFKSFATSPTFSLVNEYLDGDIAVYHFDLYRLNSVEELFYIGFEEYLFGGGICVIEWPEIAMPLLEQNYYSVNISYNKDKENSRKIIIEKNDTK